MLAARKRSGRRSPRTQRECKCRTMSLSLQCGGRAGDCPGERDAISILTWSSAKFPKAETNISWGSNLCSPCASQSFRSSECPIAESSATIFRRSARVLSERLVLGDSGAKVLFEEGASTVMNLRITMQSCSKREASKQSCGRKARAVTYVKTLSRPGQLAAGSSCFATAARCPANP